ncbi:MAG TPA: DUF87 domain-containing protein [Acidimicrobiales bacterium]|nr:DUF87 domain-containing protein [Acidimicrobiales bacterium]
MSLFARDDVVGTFLGFSEGGLEFHADLVLPYQNRFQSSAMHGQFVLVALENEHEAVLGRITTIAAQGRLVTPSGEDYAIRAVREERHIPEDLRDQYLKYRVDIRILGVLREVGGDKPPVFIASHRRLPHVGAKVAFLSNDLLRHVAGADIDAPDAAELGFLAFGEFVHSGDDVRLAHDDRLQIIYPAVIPKFEISQLVSRRSFVFARAGFGKSNLIKLLFANLYGGRECPLVEKRKGRKVPVGTLIFDPDGEYFWPDDKGRPGLCDSQALQDRVVVFTDRTAPSAFYQSFVVDQVHLDIRELPAAKVVGLVLAAEQQDRQNVQKLKALTPDRWRRLVDAIYKNGQATDEDLIAELLGLKSTQEMELYAARANMVRIVNALHNPTSRLLSAVKIALKEGKLCVVDISRMRGSQGLALAGVILQEIFDHNQREFTAAEPATIPTIAVIEEAQAVLGGASAHGEGPFVSWVKEGRKYDLGAVLVTQQPGSISSELLSQGDNWFIFHLLSAGDLRALKNANAHFSDDLLSSLLNEPLVGHGIFWSSVSGKPYPVPIRALSFEGSYSARDPDYSSRSLDCFAAQLAQRFAESMRRTVERAGGMQTVGDDNDPLETIKVAAIQGLAHNPVFAQHAHEGMKWGRVQHLLADSVDTTLVPDPVQWVHEQRLVLRALNELLGPEGAGWASEKRDGATWVKALAAVKRPMPPPPTEATPQMFGA